MTIEAVEKFLAVGAVATLNSNPGAAEGQRFRTAIRGWKRGEYIILDKPSGDAGILNLREHQHCVVHFFSEGMACGFDAEILDGLRLTRGMEFSVSWPARIHSTPVRKFERVKMSLPCSLTDDRGTSCAGEVQDLSEGGCLVRANIPFAKGAILTLRITLPDGVVLENMHAEVRNVRLASEGAMVGCAFRELTADMRGAIGFHVSSAFAHMRETHDAVRRVLLLQETKESTPALTQGVTRHRWELVSAVGLVEGLYRFQLLHPQVLLVDHRLQPDAAGIAAAVLKSHSAENVLVFLYGGPAAEMKPLAEQAGLSGHVPAELDPARLDSGLLETTLRGKAGNAPANPAAPPTLSADKYNNAYD